MKKTPSQVKAATIQNKWAEGQKCDPEVARRAERLMREHQGKAYQLNQLLREKIRSLVSVDVAYELIKLFMKQDMARRDVISWHEFDMILQSSGVHLSGSEVRLLGKFFDSTGDHGVPYLDFVAWLDVLMDLKTLTKTFPTGNMFTGAHAKKAPPERVMSAGYMTAWLAKHKDDSTAAEGAEMEARLKIMEIKAASEEHMRKTTPSLRNRNPAQEGELADLRAMSQAMKENTAYNDERKVMEAFKERRVLKATAASLLRDCLGRAGVSKERVEGLWRACDRTGDGYISWKEFCTSMKEAGVCVNDSDIMRLMSEFDGNADGGVDYRELVRLLFPETGMSEEAVLKQTFSRTVNYKKELAEREAEKFRIPRHVQVSKAFAPATPQSAAYDCLKGGHGMHKLIPNSVPATARLGNGYRGRQVSG